MNSWPFADPPNFLSFSTRQVMERGDPILAVYHTADDSSWQFMGVDDGAEGDLVVICLEHAVHHDPTVAELADLPLGWGATRPRSGAPWTRFELPPEEEE